MKRWLKNLICITGLVLSLGLIVSTIVYLKNNSDVAYSLSKVEIALEETLIKDETVIDTTAGDGTSSSEESPDALLEDQNELTTENPTEEVESGDATNTSDDTTIDDSIVDKSLDDGYMYATGTGTESNGIVDTMISKTLSTLSINNQIATGYIVLLLIGSFFFIFNLAYLIFSKLGKEVVFSKILKLLIFIVASKAIAIGITIGLIYLINTYII